MFQRVVLPAIVVVFAGLARAQDAPKLLFSESFDDAELLQRKWYDTSPPRIAGEAVAGKGCIEFEWADRGSTPLCSSAARRLFEPSEQVAIRYYLKLSKGWGWSGRDYHPHLTHFMTTENGPWHGPAASHLTLYIEPMGGKLRLAFGPRLSVERHHRGESPRMDSGQKNLCVLHSR